MVPLGQKSENFCGATQIDGKTVRSATCQHTPFLGNGGKARRYLLRKNSVQSALHSPFGKGAPATIPPPATLCVKPAMLTRLRHWFVLLNLAQVYSLSTALSRDKKYFLTMHKKWDE